MWLSHKLMIILMLISEFKYYSTNDRQRDDYECIMACEMIFRSIRFINNI